jgi:hypothetical protein
VPVLPSARVGTTVSTRSKSVASFSGPQARVPPRLGFVTVRQPRPPAASQSARRAPEIDRRDLLEDLRVKRGSACQRLRRAGKGLTAPLTFGAPFIVEGGGGEVRHYAKRRGELTLREKPASPIIIIIKDQQITKWVAPCLTSISCAHLLAISASTSAVRWKLWRTMLKQRSQALQLFST